MRGLGGGFNEEDKNNGDWEFPKTHPLFITDTAYRSRPL